MVIQFLSYSAQSPLPTVLVWNESLTTSYATTVANPSGNIYTATLDASALAGYFWVNVSLTGGGTQAFAIKIANNVSPALVGQTIDELRMIETSTAPVVTVLPYTGSTPDRVAGTTITTFYNESTPVTVNLDGASLDAMTLEFIVENRAREDVLVLNNQDIARSGENFTVTVTVDVTQVAGTYSWSLRNVANGVVLGHGPLVVKYAAFNDG